MYTCPAGKTLTTTGKLVNDGETLLYLASTRDCRSCMLKARCCPKTPFRRVPRSIYEQARDVARALAKTEAFEQSRRDRKRVEMMFAHLKRILRLGRLRLRGPRGAQFEFTGSDRSKPPPACQACGPSRLPARAVGSPSGIPPPGRPCDPVGAFGPPPARRRGSPRCAQRA